MFTKFVCLTACLLLVIVAGTPIEKRSSAPLNIVSIIKFEDGCVRQGGVCKRIEDCPQNDLTTTQLWGTLCPQQRHLGVECCYDRS